MPPLMKRLPIYAVLLAGILVYQWWRGQQPKEILVEVDGGAFRVAGHPVAANDLPAALRAAREQSPELPLVVRAEPGQPAGAVLPIVEAAREAGIRDVQFETGARR